MLGYQINEIEMRIVTAILCLGLVGAGLSQRAAAAEIYRWIDADGAVHYSDEKPRNDESFTTINVPDSRPSDYDPLEDPYSIHNQARRINESWAALAAARDERAEARTMAMRNAQTTNPDAYLRADYGTRYYTPWRYSSFAPLNFQRRFNPGAASRQLQAIEGLQLSGPRPASINSGIHRERVQRSIALPVTQ